MAREKNIYSCVIPKVHTGIRQKIFHDDLHEDYIPKCPRDGKERKHFNGIQLAWYLNIHKTAAENNFYDLHCCVILKIRWNGSRENFIKTCHCWYLLHTQERAAEISFVIQDLVLFLKCPKRGCENNECLSWPTQGDYSLNDHRWQQKITLDYSHSSVIPKCHPHDSREIHLITYTLLLTQDAEWIREEKIFSR